MQGSWPIVPQPQHPPFSASHSDYRDTNLQYGADFANSTYSQAETYDPARYEAQRVQTHCQPTDQALRGTSSFQPPNTTAVTAQAFQEATAGPSSTINDSYIACRPCTSLRRAGTPVKCELSRIGGRQFIDGHKCCDQCYFEWERNGSNAYKDCFYDQTQAARRSQTNRNFRAKPKA